VWGLQAMALLLPQAAERVSGLGESGKTEVSGQIELH